MALVRFDQEPGYPDGVGTFHADDGSTFFGQDPEMAAQLSQPNEMALGPYGPPQEDERTALLGFPDTEARLASGGQEAPAPPPTATDAPMQVDTAKFMQQGGAPADAPPAVRAALATQTPPTPAMAAKPGEQQSPALGQAEALQQSVDAYVPQYKRVAASPGGVRPITQSEVRETSGIPYDPNGPEARARAEASINYNLAGIDKAKVESARAAGKAAAYQAALPQLQEQARVAQMRRDMQERQYRRDREDLEAAMEQSNKSASSFNANRWFEDRGAIGQIGAAIAQAFGAGAAALTGGPNVVLNQINSYIDRDIANQRAAIEADEKKATGALAQLNRQYQNLDQAEAALRIAQQKKVEKMAQAYAASTKSEDVMTSLNMWLAENEQRRIAAEQQFQNASYGKTTLTTAAKVIPATRGGVVPLTEKEKVEYLNTLNKRNEVIGGAYETEIKRQKASGVDPEKKDKESERLIENLDGTTTLARSPAMAAKIQEMKALHTNAKGSLQALGQLAKSGSSISPDDQRSFDLNLEQVVNSANTIAGQGVVRSEDLERIKKSLQNRVGSMPAEKAVAELETILDRAYQSRVDAQRGTIVKEQQTQSGPRVSYTGQESKNPTAKTMFKKRSVQ